MANYSVETYRTQAGDIATVLGLIETKIETIDDSKTIRMQGLVPVGGDVVIGYLVYDA